MSATEMLTLAPIDALLRPLLLIILVAGVLVAVAVARDVLATPYPELRDHDCAWDNWRASPQLSHAPHRPALTEEDR